MGRARKEGVVGSWGYAQSYYIFAGKLNMELSIIKRKN